MAKFTKRKILRLLSFVASFLVAWLTGATNSARANEQGLKDPVESSIWQLPTSRQAYSSATLLPFDESLDPEGNAGLRRDPDTKTITIAAYESESPSVKAGSGKDPVRSYLFTPRSSEVIPTEREETVTLERLMNTRERVKKSAQRCQTKIRRGEEPIRCITKVLEEFEKRLAREANHGSAVAESALPIVRQLVVEVRNADSEEAALEAIRDGIGKVQRIRLVRSQDTVIANLQRQQRAVIAETLQSVEVNLAAAMSI